MMKLILPLKITLKMRGNHEIKGSSFFTKYLDHMSTSFRNLGSCYARPKKTDACVSTSEVSTSTIEGV